MSTKTVENPGFSLSELKTVLFASDFHIYMQAESLTLVRILSLQEMCSVSEVRPDLLRRESLGGVGHKATDGSGSITGGKPREPLYHEVPQCKLATISFSL